MSSTQCKVCKWERENKIFVDTSRSKVAWASRIGCNEASVRRHFKHAPKSTDNRGTKPEDGGNDEFITEMGIPSQLITTRGMSIRDPETGSWQKVSWQPNAKAVHDSLGYDDLEKALDGWEPNAFVTDYRRNQEFTSVLNAADLQIGKAMQRGGGTPETVARVKQSVAEFAARVVRDQPQHVILADNGDPIENCFNTPAQLPTNDLSVPEQIRVFRRLMLEAIKTLAPLVENFTYVAVPSNHGAFRTGYKAAGGTVDADFGLEISYQLQDAVEENPFLENVNFVRPKPLDETAEIETSNTKLAFNHGHQSGGLFRHGDWWAKQDHGRQAGWDADIMVFGHFHTEACYSSGNGRLVIGCSSSDPGSDWFTNKAGESARPGMTMFNARDGLAYGLETI